MNASPAALALLLAVVDCASRRAGEPVERPTPAAAARASLAPAPGHPDSDSIELEGFERIVQFILRNGDRETYGNRFNHNPHYRFGQVDAYLDPEIRQANINCDPAISGFDVIVIRTTSPEGPTLWLSAHADAGGHRVTAEPGTEGEVTAHLREILRQIEGHR